MNNWEELEYSVKKYAEYIWDRTAAPERIEGVNFDCVLHIHDNEIVIIEVTKNNSLQKIREDITKIETIAISLIRKFTILKPFIVCDFTPTPGMRDAGREKRISVLSFNEFQRLYFDFPSYKTLRDKQQFGSAIDPISGEKDNSEYIPVKYILKDKNTELSVQEIANLIKAGNKIILTGDYGTGKSRCFAELFKILADDYLKCKLIPIAIDLKDTWGLVSAVEIIRRHFSHLGINESKINNIIKSFQSDGVCFLLDGFDEVGSKPWSEDKESMQMVRRFALQGVYDLIKKTNAGVIVSGREHYFNSNKEMYSALGLSENNAMLIHCKEEFSYDEFQYFLDINNIDVEFPSWIPKKPLILKTFSSMDAKDIEEIFEENDIKLWFKFIKHMCDRDSRIHPVLDGSTVRQVLQVLANLSREKSSSVGPISEKEVFDAFYEVTRTYPNEQATIMLQRLPGLGRVSRESGERNFIDEFILDGLRALELHDQLISNSQKSYMSNWLHPLKHIGTRVLAYKINENNTLDIFVDLSKGLLRKEIRNKALVSDIISSLSMSNTKTINYNNVVFDEPHFGILDFRNFNIENLELSNGIIEEVHMGKSDPTGILIKNCDISKIYGISSKTGLPEWIVNPHIDQFELVDTLGSIKKSGLSKSQTILVSILIKVYRQYGRGRLEHTLTKGLSQVDKTMLNRVLKVLVQHGFIELSKDRKKNETIYKPVNKLRNRVESMLSELDTSNDDLWTTVSALK